LSSFPVKRDDLEQAGIACRETLAIYVPVDVYDIMFVKTVENQILESKR